MILVELARLDRLVRDATSFRDFNDLRDSMVRDGYVPSLRWHGEMSRALGRELEKLQLPVFWIGRAHH